MSRAIRTLSLVALPLSFAFSFAGAPGLGAQAAGPEGRGHELFPVYAGAAASATASLVLRAEGGPGAPATATGRLPVPGVSADGFAVAPVPALQDRRARGTRFMIGGAVAVLVGSVIGGDGGTLFVVGGLVAAGYGFYLYHEP